MNDITRPIEVITQEINFYKFQAGNAIIEIGKRLLEAKQCLPHGAWGDWLQNEVEFSERSAQNFMRIAKEYRNPQLIADMGNSATKALLLLSVPEAERETFVENYHEIDGESKTIAEMSTKEVAQLVKELEAERAEKEKLRSQLDLFQTEKDNAVDAAYQEATDKLEALVSQREAAEKAKVEAEEKLAIMETEMNDLRIQAMQTAIPDESELERIRSEAESAAQRKAEEALQKKLEKAKKEAEKAKKEAAEAQAAIEAHESAQKEAEEAANKAREDLCRLKEETEKRLRATGSTGITRFKVYFEGVQNEINQAMDCIQEVEESEGEAAAEKLRKALEVLCHTVLAGIQGDGKG